MQGIESMKCRVRFISIRGVALLGALFMSGCLSDNPGSRSIAYVDILSQDAKSVKAAAERVFADDGYKLVKQTEGELVFQREATQRDQVMYGTYGESLSMGVVVFLEPRRQGGILVRADAYALHPNSKIKVLRIARRPYQDLLDRVKASFAISGGVQ
jgi:hypothetical protein